MKLSLTINNSSSLRNSKKEFEKLLISARLMKFKGNVTKTAESLKMERCYLHRKMKKLGVTR